MRYLRMLTNALAGGVLVALYLVVLVLQLNPQVPVVSTTAGRWFVALITFYGPYAASVIYFLILIREALVSRPLSPAWLSVRLMAWLGAAVATAAAIVTWANLRAFRAVLSDAAAERMQEGATATTVFAGMLFTVAVLRYSFGRRGSRAAAVLLVASILLSVAVPLWLRGPVEPPVPTARRAKIERLVGGPPPPRVRLLLVDGASLGFIRQRVAGGQLPNFGRLLDSGATIDLATVKPTHAIPVWAAAATGKYPPKTGVRSDALYKVRPDDDDPVDLLPDYCFARALVELGFVTPDQLTSTALGSRPLWDIVADYGFASGIVAWPLTSPAHAARGYVISDGFDDAASSPLRLADAKAGDPTSAADIAREVFDQWQARPWPEILPTFSLQETAPAARWDHAYSEAASILEQHYAPTLTAVRYEGLDIYGHLYLPDAEPERFGVRREDPRRSPLDRYYAYLDGEIERAIARQEDGDLLLVVAGFGMEPSPPPKRLIMWLLGLSEPPGTHEPAPDGFLLAYGTHVAHGSFERGSIVDIAPTVLYYMGLDIGRDMDGFARTDLFLRTYTLDRPVKYIGTHETGEEVRRTQ